MGLREHTSLNEWLARYKGNEAKASGSDETENAVSEDKPSECVIAMQQWQFIGWVWPEAQPDGRRQYKRQEHRGKGS